MHDPLTVAHEIKVPLPWKRKPWRGQEPEWSKYRLATIWHKDPERDGTDDSCGWFQRARHGDKATLERIVKRMESDWDRVFQTKKEDHDPDEGEFRSRVYFCGLFCPNGEPHLSVSGVVLNLMFIAACEHFNVDGRSNWKRARRFMQKHLFDILLFAENPSDSLFDGITMKFGTDGFPSGNTFKDARHREERIRNMAGCCYSWILRQERPWWKHPKWHIHHWRLQVPFLQSLRRWVLVRCSKCGKRFSWGESAIGSWSGKAIWHQRCDDSSKPDQCSP